MKIEPGVYKLLANYETGGYKCRPMSGWNVHVRIGRIGSQPFVYKRPALSSFKFFLCSS